MRECRDIGAFLRFMETMPEKMRAARNLGLRDAAEVIAEEARAEIGHYQDAAGPFAAWPELADSTKRERVELGFTENDPLLRTGALRESIGIAYGDGHAEVGSDSPVAVDMELGTKRAPPRSFLGGAAVRREKDAVDIIAGAVAEALAGTPPTRRHPDAGPPGGLHDIPF